MNDHSGISDSDEQLLEKILNKELEVWEISACKDRDRILGKLFHALWSKATRCDNYNKQEWMILQFMLQKRGIDV